MTINARKQVPNSFPITQLIGAILVQSKLQKLHEHESFVEIDNDIDNLLARLTFCLVKSILDFVIEIIK